MKGWEDGRTRMVMVNTRGEHESREGREAEEAERYKKRMGWMEEEGRNE